jgi:hypothetical protein
MPRRRDEPVRPFLFCLVRNANSLRSSFPKRRRKGDYEELLALVASPDAGPAKDVAKMCLRCPPPVRPRFDLAHDDDDLVGDGQPHHSDEDAALLVRRVREREGGRTEMVGPSMRAMTVWCGLTLHRISSSRAAFTGGAARRWSRQALGRAFLSEVKYDARLLVE